MFKRWLNRYRRALFIFAALACVTTASLMQHDVAQAANEAVRRLGDSLHAGWLKLSDGSSNYVTIKQQALSADWTLTLPTSDGTNGQVLTTNGSGTSTSWTSVSGFGVTTFADKTIPYASDTDTFEFDATNFYWDNAANANVLVLGSGTAGGHFKLLEGSGGGTSGVTVAAPSTLAGDYTITLPLTQPADTAIPFCSAAGTLAHDATNFNWDDASNSNELTLGSGTAAGQIKFLEGSGGGTNFIGLKGPATAAANVVFVLPNADATSAGQGLTSDASATTSWQPFYYQIGTHITQSTVAGNAGATAFTFTGEGTDTIPANRLSAGAVLKIVAGGTVTTDGSESETLTLTFKIGTKTIYASAATDMSTASTAIPWTFTCELTELTAGGTGTAFATGLFSIDPGAAGSAITAPFGASITSFDTTATEQVTVTATWANGDATPDVATMDLLNISYCNVD